MSGVLLYVKYNNPEKTTLMLYRKYNFSENIKPVEFLSLSSIPDGFKKMTISTEDYRFYSHPGIDIEAIKRAYYINKKVGYRMYGASTITQQLSRTLFLVPEKLLIRKYVEILIALEMEVLLPKDRIFELYLNYCELGHGVFGIQAASNHYYGCDVEKMTVDQSSRLITILANPIKFSPYKFSESKLLSNRFYMIKFRYYTYLKFQESKGEKSQTAVLN